LRVVWVKPRGVVPVFPHAVIELGFSAPMDPALVEEAFAIWPEVPGTLEWPRADQIVFRPRRHLEMGAEYRVRVLSSAQDLRHQESLAAYEWTFEEAGRTITLTGPAPSHTFSAAGTYTVSLVVTDNAGATGNTAQSVTVSAPPVAQTMSIGALSGSATSRKGGWTADVTITVVDGSGAALSGATVTGTWSSGAGTTCTTVIDGTCTVSVKVARKASTVTWMVDNVTKASYTYLPGSLTSITVDAP